MRALRLTIQGVRMEERAGRLRRQDGAAAVEFALILPVLLLILVGIIQFGIVWSQWQVMEGAAREGARCAAVQASGYSDCKVQDAIDFAAGSYTPTNDATVSLACTDATVGQNVTVSWDQTYSLGTLARLVPVIPDTITGTMEATFRCE
jgi:Flp pilus assembly protein TadG